MNKQDFNEKLDELLANIPSWLKEECNHIYGSGFIDTERFENNFELPRLLLYVAVGNLLHEMKCNKENRKEIPNLRRV